MNPLTTLLQRFKRKRKAYLHKPIRFQELSFSYTCTRCGRPVHTTMTWQEWNQGAVRYLQQQGLCEKCSE